VGALEDLRDAATRLENARLELDAALVQLGFRDEERHAIGALGADVVGCARHLLSAATFDQLGDTGREIALVEPLGRKLVDLFERHGGEIEAMGEELAGDDAAEMKRFFESLTRMSGEGEGTRTRFVLAFKSTYFIIRALQDALYRVAYEVVEGRQPPDRQHASMRRAAANNGDPVRTLLGDFADGYFLWFDGWRNLRNSIKLGRPASIVGPGAPEGPTDNLGISLTLIRDGAVSTDLSRGTRISDVAVALDATTGLFGCVCAAARKPTER